MAQYTRGDAVILIKILIMFVLLNLSLRVDEVDCVVVVLAERGHNSKTRTALIAGNSSVCIRTFFFVGNRMYTYCSNTVSNYDL